jgi:hypothetical protein
MRGAEDIIGSASGPMSLDRTHACTFRAYASMPTRETPESPDPLGPWSMPPPRPLDPSTPERQELEDFVVDLLDRLQRAEARMTELFLTLSRAPRPREWPRSAYWDWWIARWKVLTGNPPPRSVVDGPDGRVLPPQLRKREKNRWR